MTSLRNYSWPMRMKLFLGVCIPLRILIGIALYFILDLCQNSHDPIMGIILCIGLIASIFLSTKLWSRDAWWYRSLELLISLTMVIYAIIYFVLDIEPKWISMIWFIDIFIGFITFLIALKTKQFMVQYSN